MKKGILLILLLSFCIFNISSQSQEIPIKILLIYEENNESIGLWINLFKEESIHHNVSLAAIPVSDIGTHNLYDYEYIIIFGSVMAFTMNEPIRNWLKTKPDLSYINTGLVVTASSWFLKTYFNQLMKLLKQQRANIVDAVSSATKKMDENQKRSLIKNHFLNLLKEK